MASVEYRHGAHTIYDVKYHLVWVTKYRYAVLAGEIAVRARDTIRQICKGHYDYQRSCESRSRSPVCIDPAADVGGPWCSIHQGSIFSVVAARVCGIEASLLGSAPLGSGLLLCLVGHGDGRDDQNVYRTSTTTRRRRIHRVRREALAGFRRGLSRLEPK